jgi:Retroviral aspartyl protease
MCASQLQSKHKTLKFQGQIGQLAVMAMIDSGSTHSFINPTIVQILDLPTTSATLTVITVSGIKLTSSLLCSQLQFTLQNHNFIVDLRVLQVTDHDIILGMDWLNFYSPISYDGYKGEFTIRSNGKLLCFTPCQFMLN